MPTLAAGLVIANSELAARVRESIGELPVRVLFQRRDVSDAEALALEVERQRPELLIVELEGGADRVENVLRALKAAAGGPALIGIQPAAQPDIIVAAMRAGADEYLYPPFDGRLRAAIERITSRPRTRGGAAAGKTLGFLSAKGGCGATTVACHVAVEFQRQSQLQILLADFDVEAGMVRFYLKSKSSYSVADAANNVHRLDSNFWRAVVSNGAPRLDVISAPASPTAQIPSEEAFRQVARFARGHYDWVLVDLGRSLSARTLRLMDEIDETFLVVTLDVPALYQAKQILQAVQEAGYDRRRLHVLVNQMPKHPEVTLAEIERMLGIPVFATVPSDSPALYDAYAGGKLVPPGSPLGVQFARLAAGIGHLPGRISAPKRRFALFEGESR